MSSVARTDASQKLVRKPKQIYRKNRPVQMSQQSSPSVGVKQS